DRNNDSQLDLHIADGMLPAIYPDARTTFEALQSRFEHITFVEGCDYVGESKNDFELAVQAAKDADIIIMTLGGRNGWGTYCTSGEGIDTTNIGLPGCQEELLHRVYEANPNMILVHTDCRPVVSSWIYDHVPAILEAWLPCTYGGEAIAETITGENNPGGRLHMDVPRSLAHGPAGHYFNRGTECKSFRNGAINQQGYINEDMEPQFPFGYGLSYTTFAYRNFSLSMDGNEQVTVSVDVTNTGMVKGDEVVQLYGVDKVASIVRPAEELIGFKRITLEPGETKTVKFIFNIDILAFYDKPKHWILEKGEFEFYVGKNSNEPIYSDVVTIGATHEVDHMKRCLIAEAVC
ncbi:MAG: glycoside hydrolase family 3 C-terminal domain-containing protein, partial [Ruminococcus flavefaciens]|nr:glycoside hydrolase family 3 C-terminal domain-containing protein [Ruminococcus flavefaciens]